MFKWLKTKKENNTLTLKNQMFFNARTVGFQLISIIGSIKERTWDKDLCDDIMCDCQDLVRYYANVGEARKTLDSILKGLTLLSLNVNETDKETLNGLISHVTILWKDFKCVEEKI